MKFYSSKHIITTSKPPGKTEDQKIVFYKAQKWVFYKSKNWIFTLTLQHQNLVILHEKSDQKLACLIYTSYFLSLLRIRGSKIPIFHRSGVQKSIFCQREPFHHEVFQETDSPPGPPRDTTIAQPDFLSLLRIRGSKIPIFHRSGVQKSIFCQREPFHHEVFQETDSPPGPPRDTTIARPDFPATNLTYLHITSCFQGAQLDPAHR